ncbi:MAG TPA: AtpZ/AtpI family protein [Syntrophales bacterium]|nr:AtpZ/AtpI family protein [Syntrophales bacterium]
MARGIRRGQGQRVRHAWGVGFAQYGLVGWTVALPMIIGAVLGYWIDSTVGPGGFYWTVLLMLAGLAVGIAATWLWMRREIRHDRSLS